MLGVAGFLVASGNGAKSGAVGTEVGNLAPSFQAETTMGEDISNTMFAGRVVVMTSGAAWCPTCVLEAQQFSPAYKQLEGRDVVFITIDIDPRDSAEFINRFREENDTPGAIFKRMPHRAHSRL